MSVPRPLARSLFSRRLVALSTPPAQPCHHHSFHTSPPLAVRRRPRFKNIRAADMGLVTEEKVEQFAQQNFPRFTPEEVAELGKRFSPEQITALEAGEASIDPKDLTVQGRLRVDPYILPYIEDFADIQPIIDKRPKNKAPPDPTARFMDLDEFTADLVEWADKFKTGDPTGTMKRLADFVPEKWRHADEKNWPAGVRDKAKKDFLRYVETESSNTSSGVLTDADVLGYILERSSMTDKNRQSNSLLAPALPNKVPGVAGLYKNAIDPADEGLDDSGIYQDLKKRTGMTVRQILSLRVKVIVRRYVVNQTRLGKVRSASIMAFAGNENGWLGIGMAKSTEGPLAMEKAKLLAIADMKPIPRYENRTVYGNIEGKVGATVVQLFPRPPGFGLRVPFRIFELCRAAGIRDLAAKMPRARSPMNSVKALHQALMNQKDPEKIAEGRGRKLVDVRKVYYGGAVY
ncbi:hypothetical protein B0T24DRAFT_630016 [Lasiosphaeria ovina]|uniref:S5 DRBM domain-containing protein n=1 Tax=Lasiosphaeria ovina TaxID=92902 RepID=A0AAE0N5P5_9PEZI|nr:hypothetical protein B0T24DRAFT_630016 [Lasiosphaeria ovina]